MCFTLVFQWTNFALLFLPLYAPELNPAEKMYYSCSQLQRSYTSLELFAPVFVIFKQVEAGRTG